MSDSFIDDSKPVIVFDGNCRFCLVQVDNLKKLDTARLFEFIPRQNKHTQQTFPQLKDITLEEGLLLIEPDGTTYKAADAFYHIARKLPGVARLAWLYEIPLLKQAIQLGYWIVARNRQRLGRFCTSGSCQLTQDNGTEAARHRPYRHPEDFAMNEDARVSESVTGQDQPPPSREERDASFSLGAGRKAQEVEISDRQLDDSEIDDDDDVPLSAPVGLELETEANEIDAER